VVGEFCLRCGAPTDDSPRRQPWDPRPEEGPAPAGRQTQQAPMHWKLTRSREGGRTLSHAGTRGSPTACRGLSCALPTPPLSLEGERILPTSTPGKTGNSDAFRSAISVPRREKSQHSKDPNAKTRGCAGDTALFHAETPRAPRGSLLPPFLRRASRGW
jgi:hypothetical protein